MTAREFRDMLSKVGNVEEQIRKAELSFEMTTKILEIVDHIENRIFVIDYKLDQIQKTLEKEKK